ncbi:uncharacterized protein LOC142339800 [Convolutriloba macropyga]|uniref:uncharacterized protein LOC142339800 n=1 Tax=Convolutriloba macropyga TaxID=536237 RepID=UPI003F51D5F6
MPGGDTMTAATESTAPGILPHAPQNTPKPKNRPIKSSKRKGVFISYSTESDYLERKFITELVSTLNTEYNLGNDMWVDLKENCLSTSSWMSQRLEMAERCKGALVVLSNAYMDSRQCVNELKTILERSRVNPKSIRVYVVLYEAAELSSAINEHISGKVDLSNYDMENISEKVFITAGTLGPQLEKRFAKNATIADKGTGTEFPPSTEEEGDGEKESTAYKKKALLHWDVDDVQSWLRSKGVPDFFLDAFLEREIDGFLLSSLGEQELADYLLVDKKHISKKIPELVQDRLKQDLNRKDNWHCRLSNTKERPSTIYLIFDPKDIGVAFNIQKYFTAKGFFVTYHQKLGQSREEFLMENGPIMAQCSNFLVIMSQSGASSPFVYNEVVFVEWMERNMCTVLMRGEGGGGDGHEGSSIESKMRVGMKAILEDKPAATLSISSFNEDMEVVEYLVAPARPIPSHVVLQQEYVYMLTENIRCLADFFSTSSQLGDLDSSTGMASVFLSYHWDIQVEAYKLSELLQYCGIPSWADFSSAATPQRSKAVQNSTSKSGNNNNNNSNSSSPSSSVNKPFETAKLDTLQNQIIRNMRKCSAVVCCFSEQYPQSANCHKDMYTAMAIGKPIVPVLLTNTKFPPEAPQEVRTLMAKYTDRVLDLSTGRLLQQNMPKLVHMIQKCLQI